MSFGRASSFGSVLVGTLLLISSSLAQPTLSGKQETRYYTYGVGRIAWTIPKDLEVIFAVPHWTAGPRLKCANRRYECEVQVSPRDISISAEQRLSQLEATAKPSLQHASEKTFKPYRHGIDKSVIYTTLHDPRPAEPFRYLTIGYAHKGPAVVKFEALTNDAIDIVAILNLVHSAKAIDALEMWAFRFSDYKAVCEEQFSMYKSDNDAAFTSSPFAAVDLVRFFMQQNPSRTEEGTRKELDEARQSYSKEFDSRPQAERQSFCEAFPRLIAEAAQGVQAR
jgi:hypothetical protein